VDHARFEGDIDMPVESGGRVGAITSNQPRFFSPHHLGEIARFRPGEMYRADMVEDLRRAVLATGLVGTVSITPRSVAAPQGDPPGRRRGFGAGCGGFRRAAAHDQRRAGL
jgi:translocation and assembly module TamA